MFSLSLNNSFRYNSPISLGIGQEVEQIMTNVFYSTYKMFFLSRFLHFVTF